MKTVLVLGSTGSIGKSTLEVLDLHKENFKCIGLSANKNFQALHEQANKYSVKNICIQEGSTSETDIEKNSDIKIYRGSDGQSEMIRDMDADIVVVGISGAIGLEATHEAIKTGKRVLIANKEPLVMCGEFLLNEAKKYQSEIIPLDSEHSAIFQCLQGSSKDDINKIILCCSGGPFWDKKIESFEKITVQDALNHPIWKMGEKISKICYSEVGGWLILLHGNYIATMDSIEDSPRIKKILGPPICAEFAENSWFWTGWRNDGRISDGEISCTERKSIGVGILNRKVLTNNGTWSDFASSD